MSRRAGLALVLGWALLSRGLGPAAAQVSVDDFLPGSYTDPYGTTLPYRLFVPAGYTPTALYPLVLFLHGAGERGTDNRLQLTGQTAELVFAEPENQARWPAFMLAPQAPLTDQWVEAPFSQGSYSQAATPISPSLRATLSLVDWLETRYSVDANRLYVTGLSMGGYGTWDAAERQPSMFAAAIPIAGAGDPSVAGSIADLRVWAFHSADDPVVPVSGSRDMVAAMRAAGGSPLYTEYANAGHFSWVPAYATPELLPWMYAQRRSAESVPEPSPAVPLCVGLVGISVLLRRRHRSDRGPAGRHRPGTTRPPASSDRCGAVRPTSWANGGPRST